MEKSIQFSAPLPIFQSVSLVFFCLFFSSHLVAQSKSDTTSYVQTVDINTGEIDTILAAKGDFEAPNWHPDNYLVMNFRGKMYKLDLASKALNVINTGSVDHLMDDHGISPDGKFLAITDFDSSGHTLQSFKFNIYTVPATGGEPKKISSEALSFWHGWSPDGKYIYFHSYRTQHMQIWRMHTDGSQPEQMTFDENANWFPHPSPNNKWIAYIAYTTDEKQNHPFGKNVKLRLMDIKTKTVKDITAIFFGGAGTINTPSWSPDSRKVAFVSYSVK